MNLTVNGKALSIDKSINLKELLTVAKAEQPDYVTVELNGEFVDALDQDGKERRVTVLALRKLVATQGDGRWLTKSLDETESAFKGRYQPKAWRGALPSLRLRDLSAGE